MPWQLPPELAERVQRARRLLAESEEHAGSTELQVRRQLLLTVFTPCARVQ